MVITSFRELDIWKRAIDVTKKVYVITKGFSIDEKFGLISQLRRAVVSISSNISEGSNRGTKRDFANFISIALGSLHEVQSQLFLSGELGYLESGVFSELDLELEELARMLIGFRKYLLG